MEILEGVICQGRNTLNFHNSPDDTQPHSVIVNWEDKDTGQKLEVCQLLCLTLLVKKNYSNL